MFGSGAVGKVGWIQPFLMSGAVLVTVGAGLIYTLDATTAAGRCVGYQIIAGAGLGLVVQVPIVAAQSTNTKSDFSVATSTILYF